jgi:predicted NAD-dependent protein-ADP-ribosyltransferase YbiA (DUF1768 family)
MLTIPPCQELPPGSRSYRKEDVCWFHKKTDPLWTLSNMCGGLPIYAPLARSRDNLWRSSEHLYQASKYDVGARALQSCSRPGADSHLRSRIRSQRSPRGAKMTQKCGERLGLVRPDWLKIRVAVMTRVVELKL